MFRVMLRRTEHFGDRAWISDETGLMYMLARSVSSRRQLFSESAASWAASVMKVTFNTGGRLFPGCFAKRCTRCTCMGSIPSVVASWRTKMVSVEHDSTEKKIKLKSAKNILVWFLILKILVFYHILRENRL